METIPRARRERAKGTETKGGSREWAKSKRTFLESGCESRARALLVRRAYLAAECTSAENEGNRYCLVSGGR